MRSVTALFCFFFFGVLTATLRCQDVAAGTKAVRIQAGAGGVYLRTDYTNDSNKGVAFWADYDFQRFLGMEAEVRLGGIVAPDDIGENSYLFGPRLTWRRRAFALYGKIVAGHATITNQILNQSSSFNVYAFGGGLEYKVTRKLNVRVADVELEKWPDFQPNSLSPLAITVGMSYVLR